MKRWNTTAAKAIPLVAAASLVLAACGSDGGNEVAQEPIAPVEAAAPAEAEAPAAEVAAPATTDKAAKEAAPAAKAEKAAKAPAAATAPVPASEKAAPAAKTEKAAPAKGAKASGEALTKIKATESASDKAANEKIAQQKGGATDQGVTKDQIKLGSINMHGMALGNVLTAPQVRGNLATASAINDRGGILGRRMSIVDCDDGPGEVSRAKACIKKLAGQDKVFSLITGVDWATASIHDDLKQYKLPYVGAWAYSQTEWQDPYMFPTHMSMIHEAMANANWAKNVIAPKTYGLVCLTSPEMQLACKEVQKIMDASGSKLVKKADVSISETSMSATVLSMRAAAPEHVIHYVINPATMAKFMVEAAQQNYYPPKGISGNHLAAEVLGSLFGKHPIDRYWTNTTYKLWGPEFMATMNKYARGNRGTNHHIVQAGYAAVNIFAQAAKEVGPNLTRERLMAVLGNGTVWQSDASLDQRFQYIASERTGNNWNKQYGQGREFMYKYKSTNTVSNPDGSPSGFTPDDKQFVIYTWK
ncbi:MAG: ABC transporter substrate-binding protein [Sporichthyaceae bacterium]